MLTLLNTSLQPVDLTGWALADRRKRCHPIPAGHLSAGATVLVPLPGWADLDPADTLTLLDPAGLKSHGVAYTADQTRRPGWTIPF